MLINPDRSGILIGTAMYETLRQSAERAEQAEIALSLMEYAFEHEEVTTNPTAKIIIGMAKPYFDKTERQYKANCKNGEKGGAPEGNQNARKYPKNNPNSTENNPNSTEIQPNCDVGLPNYDVGTSENNPNQPKNNPNNNINNNYNNTYNNNYNNTNKTNNTDNVNKPYLEKDKGIGVIGDRGKGKHIYTPEEVAPVFIEKFYSLYPLKINRGELKDFVYGKRLTQEQCHNLYAELRTEISDGIAICQAPDVWLAEHLQKYLNEHPSMI